MWVGEEDGSGYGGEGGWHLSGSGVGAAQLIVTVEEVGVSVIGDSENLGHLFHCGIGKDNFGVGFLCLYIYRFGIFLFCFLELQYKFLKTIGQSCLDCPLKMCLKPLL